MREACDSLCQTPSDSNLLQATGRGAVDKGLLPQAPML